MNLDKLKPKLFELYKYKVGGLIFGILGYLYLTRN